MEKIQKCGKKPTDDKWEITPVDFPCMSAYMCPHCKKILAAYYAGNIVDLEPFMEDPALKHHYTLGISNGGQYLLLDVGGIFFFTVYGNPKELIPSIQA